MAPRPNWKGYLKLSLVSCPVALYPATTTSERVSFRTLNRETGNRVKRQFVDEQTGEPVQTEDQAKGYEVAKGEFIMLEDDELKAVQVESNHTIDIERFVPGSDIDKLYLDTPYYLAPTDRVGEEAFAVIREAIAIVSAGTAGFHLSFDMDAVDPREAPGVGTPVRGGITYREAHLAMELVGDSGRMTSLEIVEVNPVLDEANRTAALAVDLATSALGKRIL